MRYLMLVLMFGAAVWGQDGPRKVFTVGDDVPSPKKYAQTAAYKPAAQWEYKVLVHVMPPGNWEDEDSVLRPGHKDDAELELNAQGALGWELVGFTAYRDRIRYVLKRQKGAN